MMENSHISCPSILKAFLAGFGENPQDTSYIHIAPHLEGSEDSQMSLWEAGNQPSNTSLLTPSTYMHRSATFDKKLPDK